MHALWRGDYPVAATHRKLNHGRQFSHKLQVQHGGCTSTSTLKLARRVRRVRSNCVLLEVPRHGNVGGGRPERPGRRSGSARRGTWAAPKRPLPRAPSRSDPPCSPVGASYFAHLMPEGGSPKYEIAPGFVKLIFQLIGEVSSVSPRAGSRS